ncbi:hypothetical protein PMAYCL1PPCAC_25135 [Pristionchus mayeri]|uniref:BRCT domain-containing protein n=1 Tax=Pristionchus mayeri TaxID=1317129 RepID=A0AAN5D380_9BILA|nr:hypothetical protein PMAYCL1PPCAC_25135 [Pristionchus mayeri]
MSDTLVQVPAGDMKEDQPESLNVDTAQPSLLKKGGLFGKSVAVSGTPSPAEKSSENGDEDVSSQSKNGATDSNTNGDHQDEGEADATNGDASEQAHGDDEEMDEAEEDKEEAEVAKPAEPATVDEPEKKEAADVMEDIEMADEEEDEIQETEPAKKDDDVIDEEEKEKESPASPTKDDDVEAVEEVCVKKVISMDTDKTVDETTADETTAKTDDSAMDATHYESAEDEEKPVDATQEYHTAEEEEEAPVVATPKRGRGRPPKSASGTPAAVKKTPSAKTPKTPAAAAEEADEATPSKRTPRGAAKKAAEALASPTPSLTKGRGRRSIKSDTSSQPDVDEKKEEEGEEKKAEEAAEEEAKTPVPARGRRSIKTTPATATRGTPRGKKAEEGEEGEETGEKEENKGDEEGEAAGAEKTPRRGRRSVHTTPASKKETPARASKSAKKEEDDEESASVSPSRRPTRGSPTKTPQSSAKGRGRKTSVKSESTTVETETEEDKFDGDEEEEVVAKKGRGRGRKSASGKMPTASAKKAKKADDEEDPFDLDTELDKHPEPLRNITVEKKEFGECKYTRSPAVSKSKYEATERSASDKVANLPNTPAATGTPKTIASAQSTRKSLGGSPVKRTASAKRGKKSKEEGETETQGEDDDPMEEDAPTENTPAGGRKGRGRPPGSGGSAGRKRKAASPPASSSAKRPTMNVDIPELDAEAQWAADHPEDDSAPLVPGARVFAVFQKVFYPALVGERDGLGRYMVEFVEDKIVRPVPPAGVLPLSAVTIDKECLFQPSADDEPIQCRVLRSANAANAKEWQAGVFKLIEIGNEEAEHEANWTQLQLDMATSEWKKYVNMMSKKVTKINTDNITSLTDKRERRSRVHNDTAVAIATLSGTPEPTSRRSVTLKTPAESASASAPKTGSTGRGRGRKSKATLAAEMAAAEEAAKEEEKEEEKKEEDVKMETDAPAAPAKKPEMNTRIFLNKMFILTSANRTTGDAVFKKNEMKKQILERGGVVLEDINQVPLDAEAYLISDTHYRTHKYLAAMSRGMPCLSHKWLVECVQKEELAPYNDHKLAGGQGLLSGELYPLPDVRGKLLVGRSIMVHSKTDSHMKRGTMGFKQIWSPIVELLGARVVSDLPLADWSPASNAASLPDFEILLTDSSCPPEIVNKLEAAGKAVVSSEWLIQSIIMGQCPDFAAHPRFRYDSGNEPTKKEGSQDQPTAAAQS